MPTTFSYDQPYIVVGAFIEQDGKILLIQENHFPDKGKWNIPAGKLDFGEDPVQAAIREVREEAGVVFNPTAVLGIYSVLREDVSSKTSNIHAVRLVFKGSHTGRVNLNRGELNSDGEAEISDHQWLTPQEIEEMDIKLLRYWDVKQQAKDFLLGKEYPLDFIKHIFQPKRQDL
ncbi:MAG TPA: NUDIX hydrolase [Candidatus Saccharimonadales bacterium]|nr:NUDIX hydrolase [Candidatus Saccharimonadales bacterium]